MPEKTDYVTVGKFGAPHGVTGWIKVWSYTQPIDNILLYHPWHMHYQNRWQAIEIEESKVHGDALLVKLANCNDRNQASLYTNIVLGIEREKLPALSNNEYYWHDLQGLTVQNLHGETVGKVDHLFSTGANDVLVVEGKQRYLIPYVWDVYIKSVDLAQSSITVDWDIETE
jgi:16S rRNA processing protein RimM